MAMRINAGKEQIRRALSLPLPGEQAHREMMSYRRSTAAEARAGNPPPRQGAVLMLLIPDKRSEDLNTLFIRRPHYDGVHSGQLAFPGGKLEPADSGLLAAALRETQEETGIDISGVEILGSLSEIYIPPSHFIVQPFVGWAEEVPDLHPDPREVEEVLLEPLSRLLHPDNRRMQRIYMPTFKAWIDAPAMDVQGHILWGATAMMVHEFRAAVFSVE